MCSECDWSEEKGKEHQIRRLCDCGNNRWQWTSLVMNEAVLETTNQEVLENSMKSIYRCTKCDALRLAEHLLHA